MSEAPESGHDRGAFDRTLRLFDLLDWEIVVVVCGCGWIVEYPRGYLQRRHRVPSDTLLYDLQWRLRCTHCGRSDGFEIRVKDGRRQGTGSHTGGERVVVPGRSPDG